jgi:acetyl esterase/lipase
MIPRFSCILSLVFSINALAARSTTVPVWPDLDRSLAAAEKVKERGTTTQPNRFITDIRYPTLEIFEPPPERTTGTAIIICPGGAYAGIAIDKEGYPVAEWLNSIGVTAAILKYRMPLPQVTHDGRPLPLLDLQRAVRLVRSRAGEWHIDPARVGVMGFSAGGHLASTAATHFDPPDPHAADPIDRLSDRPDFIILGYPVMTLRDPNGHVSSRRNLLGEHPDAKMIEEYSNESHVTASTPPAFVIHAKDDPIKCDNSILFRDAMEKNGVPCELHLFERGGHGFGLATTKPEASVWPKLCQQWMSKNGWLKGRPATQESR